MHISSSPPFPPSPPQPADVYLIDEPSAYLDSEHRIIAAKVIKRCLSSLSLSLSLPSLFFPLPSLSLSPFPPLSLTHIFEMNLSLPPPFPPSLSLLFRFILHAKKTAFVVEHDFIMATYLADRVIVFEGTPSMKTVANGPTTLLLGMNQFLEALEITFRRDSENYRPRINKKNSVKVSSHYGM